MATFTKSRVLRVLLTLALISFLTLVVLWVFSPSEPTWTEVKPEATETSRPEFTPRPEAQKQGSEFVRTTNGQKYAYRNKLNDVVYFVRIDTYNDGTAKAELEVAPLKQAKKP